MEESEFEPNFEEKQGFQELEARRENSPCTAGTGMGMGDHIIGKDPQGGQWGWTMVGVRRLERQEGTTSQGSLDTRQRVDFLTSSGISRVY